MDGIVIIGSILIVVLLITGPFLDWWDSLPDDDFPKDDYPGCPPEDEIY